MKQQQFWQIRIVFVLAVVSLVLVAPVVDPTSAQENTARIIFMHHSTGGGLIWEGGIREQFTALGYELWDHGYNEEGLVGPADFYTSVSWNVPDDNTDPDGWYNIFQQPVTDPPGNTFSHMLHYDVILFKSCFPSSDIASEEQFEAYRTYYRAIRDVMDQHPDKLFIPFTTPPLVPNETQSANAARARQWADYLTSDEYTQGHPNVVVFDFFDHLADDQNVLRADYRADEWDSHPNMIANETVGAALVAFVDQAIQDFTPGEAVVQPVPPSDVADQGDETAASDNDEAVAHDAQEAAYDEEGLTFAQIGDFEGEIADWWSWFENGRISWETIQSGHASDSALRLAFDIEPEGYGGIGVDFAPDPAWAHANGIALYWRADQPDMIVNFALFVQDPANPDAEATPFEVLLVTPGADWEPVTIPWAEFEKVAWFGDAGVDVFDPVNVTGLSLSMEVWDQAVQGTIWVDDIELVPGK